VVPRWKLGGYRGEQRQTNLTWQQKYLELAASVQQEINAAETGSEIVCWVGAWDERT
jgi:hypothetical protein